METRHPNFDHNSYELKHQIERELGIYLTNNQMKDAMLQEGFRPVKENEINWYNGPLVKTTSEKFFVNIGVPS